MKAIILFCKRMYLLDRRMLLVLPFHLITFRKIMIILLNQVLNFLIPLHRAGITSNLVDASCGLPDPARQEMLDAGIGISNICPIATARADELSREQLRDGAESLRALVRERHPVVVAVLGVTSWRQATGDRTIGLGRVDAGLEGSELWVLPNPSGLNAHETVESLADRFRAVALAAGVPLHPQPAE